MVPVDASQWTAYANNMFIYAKRLALVTGASSGIGSAFAKELARRGMDLILTARSKEALEATAKSLKASYDVDVTVIPADLSDKKSLEKLLASIEAQKLHVDLLINNAGFGSIGPFAASESTLQRGQIDLNIGALVELSRAFLPAMIDCRSGGIINVASTAAFQPVPYMSVYSATKAFVVSFSEALAVECQDDNVAVVALCPGPTNTSFFKRATPNDLLFKNLRSPEQVVAAGLAGLERGQTVVVDGLVNGLQAQLSKFAPRKLSAKIAGSITRPKK